MKILTGFKKTPDGFYVVLVKLEPDDTIECLSDFFSLKGVTIERYGETIIFKTKSRKIQKYLYRRIKMKMKRS